MCMRSFSDLSPKICDQLSDWLILENVFEYMNDIIWEASVASICRDCIWRREAYGVDTKASRVHYNDTQWVGIFA